MAHGFNLSSKMQEFVEEEIDAKKAAKENYGER